MLHRELNKWLIKLLLVLTIISYTITQSWLSLPVKAAVPAPLIPIGQHMVSEAFIGLFGAMLVSSGIEVDSWEEDVIIKRRLDRDAEADPSAPVTQREIEEQTRENIIAIATHIDSFNPMTIPNMLLEYSKADTRQFGENWLRGVDITWGWMQGVFGEFRDWGMSFFDPGGNTLNIPGQTTTFPLVPMPWDSVVRSVLASRSEPYYYLFRRAEGDYRLQLFTSISNTDPLVVVPNITGIPALAEINTNLDIVGWHTALLVPRSILTPDRTFVETNHPELYQSLKSAGRPWEIGLVADVSLTGFPPFPIVEGKPNYLLYKGGQGYGLIIHNVSEFTDGRNFLVRNSVFPSMEARYRLINGRWVHEFTRQILGSMGIGVSVEYIYSSFATTNSDESVFVPAGWAPGYGIGERPKPLPTVPPLNLNPANIFYQDGMFVKQRGIEDVLGLDEPLTDDDKITVVFPPYAGSLAGVKSLTDVIAKAEAPAIPMPNTGINWGKFGTITIFNKFPFSIPFDVYNFFNALAATPAEPRFEFHLFPESFMERYNMQSGTGHIVLDFEGFDGIVRLIRAGFLILFIAGLMIVTKNYIWSGGG
jgi:hypothetical protein